MTLVIKHQNNEIAQAIQKWNDLLLIIKAVFMFLFFCLVEFFFNKSFNIFYILHNKIKYVKAL